MVVAWAKVVAGWRSRGVGNFENGFGGTVDKILLFINCWGEKCHLFTFRRVLLVAYIYSA